jgi:hypothetical protein
VKRYLIKFIQCFLLLAQDLYKKDGSDWSQFRTPQWRCAGFNGSVLINWRGYINGRILLNPIFYPLVPSTLTRSPCSPRYIFTCTPIRTGVPPHQSSVVIRRAFWDRQKCVRIQIYAARPPHHGSDLTSHTTISSCWPGMRCRSAELGE